MPTTRASAGAQARWNIYMPADRETATFDYGVPAELFMAKRKAGARQPLTYRRFATAAEAIRLSQPPQEISATAGMRGGGHSRSRTHCNGVCRIDCHHMG